MTAEFQLLTHCSPDGTPANSAACEAVAARPRAEVLRKVRRERGMVGKRWRGSGEQ